VAEAAKLLRLSRPSITAYITRGEITAEKVLYGGKVKWLIPIAEMNRLRAAREAGTWPQSPGAPSREEVADRLARDTGRRLAGLTDAVASLEREITRLRRLVALEPPPSAPATSGMQLAEAKTVGELLCAVKATESREFHVVARLQGDNILTRLVSVWPSVPLPPPPNPDEPLPPILPLAVRARWLFARMEPFPLETWMEMAGLPDAAHVRRAAYVAMDMRMVFSDGTLHYWARKYIVALAFDALPPVPEALEETVVSATPSTAHSPVDPPVASPQKGMDDL
jgi:hypothetical protein